MSADAIVVGGSPMQWVGNSPALEIIYWIAGVGVFAVALVGAILTVRQLKAIKRQAQATFLFELDKMWESQEFAEARTRFEKLRKDAEDEVRNLHPSLDAGSREREIQKTVSATLEGLRHSNMAEYVFIMKLCGFYETAGMLVKRQYVDFADIYGLYGGSILRLYSTAEIHINKRAEEMPQPGYLEHFITLADRSKKENAKRSASTH